MIRAFPGIASAGIPRPSASRTAFPGSFPTQFAPPPTSQINHANSHRTVSSLKSSPGHQPIPSPPRWEWRPPAGIGKAPKRALFYVPGSSQKMIDKAWTLQVDNITLDLEDSVMHSEKEVALDNVIRALRTKPKHPSAEVAVRIDVDLLEQQLGKFKDVISSIDAIVIPKFSSYYWMKIASIIHPWNLGLSLRVYALIETPTSLAWLELLLKKTVYDNWRYVDDSAAYPIRDRYSFLPSVPPELMYLSGLIFGAEDFASAMGITRTSSLLEMIFARQKLVTLAKAYGLECFDLVSTNFRDLDTLRTECEQGASFGFTGKQAIHPSQIPIIQSTFAPSEDAVDYAIRLLTRFCDEVKEGKRGAWEFEGKMIDRPVVRKAKRTLYVARDYGIEMGRVATIIETLEEIGEVKEPDWVDDPTWLL